jgi:hypothetical protein
MLNKITNTQKMPKPSNANKWIYDTWGVRKWRERERACRYKPQKEPYPFEGIRFITLNPKPKKNHTHLKV